MTAAPEQAPESLDLGIVGNSIVAALIDREARIVWHCVPRLDGDPVFCRLLRPTQLEQGVFEIGLRDMVSSTQDYITNPAVLVTPLTDSRGGTGRQIGREPSRERV